MKEFKPEYNLIEDTDLYKHLMWVKRNLELNQFSSVSELHFYMYGYHIGDSKNDLSANKRQAYWVIDFMNYSYQKLYEKSREDSTVTKMLASQTYYNYIIQIQENEKDGFEMFFILLADFVIKFPKGIMETKDTSHLRDINEMKNLFKKK